MADEEKPLEEEPTEQEATVPGEEIVEESAETPANAGVSKDEQAEAQQTEITEEEKPAEPENNDSDAKRETDGEKENIEEQTEEKENVEEQKNETEKMEEQKDEAEITGEEKEETKAEETTDEAKEDNAEKVGEDETEEAAGKDDGGDDAKKEENEKDEGEKKEESGEATTEKPVEEKNEQDTESQKPETADEGEEDKEAGKDGVIETKEGGTAENEVQPAGEKEEKDAPKEPKDDAGDKQAEESVPPMEVVVEPKESSNLEKLPENEKPTTENVAAETEETNEKHETDPHAASPPPKELVDATATVKFVLMPSGQVTTLACGLGQRVEQLKEHFSVELKMPVDVLVLMYDGKSMGNDTTLGELGVGPNATVQLEITSADPLNTPLKPLRPKPEYVMPDVITVRVQKDDGSVEDVVVEIERARRRKPYLGGYRHRLTALEYHHASAQTRPKIRPDNGIEKFCRDTQTVKESQQRQQTMTDTSTQMTGIGVFVTNMSDILVVPGKYTTADEHLAMIVKKIILLQCYFRRWKAKRTVEIMRKDLAERLQWEREEEIRKIKEKEDRIKKEFERRMNPKSKEDFDLLYHALEKWRQEELEVINSTMTGAQRKAALCHLLDQETQLIAAIGRHKIQADTENKQKRIERFLDKCASPKKWKAYDGKTTEMDTAFTIRARELKDIHSSINMKYLTQDERLDVLLTLKHTVKEHDCKLTQEIIELIDREADLLMRGVKESNLEGLRKRISTLFLQYIKTPTFNAEAARLLKVPQDPATLRKNIYFCSSCNQYLPSTDFSLSSNARVVGKCRQCTKLDNDGRTRQDYSHYRYLLKNVRKSEENFGDDSRIAFLLQEVDLRYLVENIWGSQSALSAWDDLYDLVLVRWDRGEEWSPWNCILLTKDEAAAHVKLEEVEESYGRVFCHKIRSKHTLARNYFSRLPGMAEHMRKKAGQPKAGNSLGSRAVTLQSLRA
ncbi:IQ motif and ubiquitin-like domain-containing protein [Saccoglossus kowalevskii]|uniref:IQ and ubiquitin-like domain-containing protein-like n=1 Tax=Saccoglossus kowalevskii TaxID=10224 RepID=A0ABM0GPT0_SACKO|nr:PREDICTED: IQ and ubiquitin-like domain-containing protein-like [Saccoglossus kowalevskii]